MTLASQQAIADLEKSDDVLRRSRELFPQLLLLRCDSHGAVVGVADARHDAPLGDHGYGSEPGVRSSASKRQGEGRLTGDTGTLQFIFVASDFLNRQ